MKLFIFGLIFEWPCVLCVKSNQIIRRVFSFRRASGKKRNKTHRLLTARRRSKLAWLQEGRREKQKRAVRKVGRKSKKCWRK